jgi:hypothetical protein
MIPLFTNRYLISGPYFKCQVKLNNQINKNYVPLNLGDIVNQSVMAEFVRMLIWRHTGIIWIYGLICCTRCEISVEFRSPATKCDFLHLNMLLRKQYQHYLSCDISNHDTSQTGTFYFENLWVKTKQRSIGKHRFVYREKLLLKWISTPSIQLNKIISRAIIQLRCQGNGRTLLILTYLPVDEGEVTQC